MNERIKELAEQAGLMCTEDVNAGGLLLWFKKFDLERFAELVRQDEREACAKVCESFEVPVSILGAHPDYLDGKSMAASQLAIAIRARGETK
jgi:hypothetical protein